MNCPTPNQLIFQGNCNKNILPPYWNLLSPQEINEYHQIQCIFHQEETKTKKGERLDTFVSRIKKIREFAEPNGIFSWKRSVVTGIIFNPDGIVINIHQFKLLLGKSKSLINGSLQKLGYISVPATFATNQELIHLVPLFRQIPLEIKKWTIRKCINPPSNKNAPPIPIIAQTKFLYQKSPLITSPSNDQSDSQQYPETVQNFVSSEFPCPAKFRYKFNDLINNLIPLQAQIE